MSPYHLGQFLHDQIIFDRGKNIEGFVRLAGTLSTTSFDNKTKSFCLRQLSRTYFIKDEVFLCTPDDFSDQGHSGQ